MFDQIVRDRTFAWQVIPFEATPLEQLEFKNLSKNSENSQAANDMSYLIAIPGSFIFFCAKIDFVLTSA